MQVKAHKTGQIQQRGCRSENAKVLREGKCTKELKHARLHITACTREGKHEMEKLETERM